MTTECTATQLKFHGLQRREVMGKFDGGEISSDGGGVLLRQVEKRTHSVLPASVPDIYPQLAFNVFRYDVYQSQEEDDVPDSNRFITHACHDDSRSRSQ